MANKNCKAALPVLLLLATALAARPLATARSTTLHFASSAAAAAPAPSAASLGYRDGLPRFALCISGGVRTLEHTAARYGALLRANPGTDVFLYLGLEDNRVSGGCGLRSLRHLYASLTRSGSFTRAAAARYPTGQRDALQGRSGLPAAPRGGERDLRGGRPPAAAGAGARG
jgi:hypothetical protein